MPILDNMQPKQSVICDLCGNEFKRELNDRTALTMEGVWENVSIYLSTHVSEENNKDCGWIKIDYACRECRLKIVEKFREIIASMKVA